MGKLGMIVVVVGLVGCGSSAATYPLPGTAGVTIPAGGCIIVNAAPQQLPAATVSYSLTDTLSSYVDTYEVGVVPSSNTCIFSQAASYIDDQFSGSASDSGNVPPGLYDLDVICLNTVNDCLLDTVTWSATY